LHARRKAIAAEQAAFQNVADPFPPVYTFKFDAPLAPGQSADVWYVNPARCATSTAATPYGHIRIIGK
jgi:hypothetical protein